MNNWILTLGTQPDKPMEIDTTSSPTTVYLRRFIKKIKIQPSEDEPETEAWEYEEKQIPKAEYESLQTALESPTTKLIMQTLYNLELNVEMMNLYMEEHQS